MGGMRERLIELIKYSPSLVLDKGGNWEENADHLIENGVITLPCKVGDTVYAINRAEKVQELIFDSVDLRCTCINDDCICGDFCSDIGNNICQYRFKNDFSDVDKTIFLTREKAERALKERGSDHA